MLAGSLSPPAAAFAARHASLSFTRLCGPARPTNCARTERLGVGVCTWPETGRRV